jgi:hypothetical protein
MEFDGLSGILVLAELCEFLVPQEIRSGPLKGMITNFSDWGLFADGNENREHGPTATWPGRGSRPNRAAMLFDDSLADPQPQSASIASLG